MPLIQDIRSLCTDEELKPYNTIQVLTRLLDVHFIFNLVLHLNSDSLETSDPVAVLSSPEIREEALQVMGVAKFVFALVSTSYQAAPGSVKFSAFLLDVIHCLWVGLDQTLRCLTKRVHLGTGA